VQIAERLTLAEQNSRNPGGFRKKMCDRSKTNARRYEKAVTNIAVALAENLQVDGQNQGAALGRAGTGDEVGDEAAIFHEVKLEPKGLLDSRRHILDRTDRHGAERVWDAGPLSGTRSGDFAITMRHSRHADRPQCERERDFFAEKRLRKFAVRGASQHVLANFDLRQIVAIGGERRFGIRAGLVIVHEVARNLAMRDPAQIIDAGDGFKRHTLSPGRLPNFASAIGFMDGNRNARMYRLQLPDVVEGLGPDVARACEADLAARAR